MKESKTLAVFPVGTTDDYCHNIGIPPPFIKP
jgi:hypothetical protein